MQPRRLLGLAASTLLTLSLAACGGGGGGGSFLPIAAGPAPSAPAPATYKITGTAAYGHPLVAQPVQAVDSAGKVCAKTTTASDGTYAMETTACAPGAAAVHVDGYTTPSGAPLAAVAVPPQGMAVIDGVVNVNPLTTLLAYQAAGLAGASAPPLGHAGVLALLPKVTAAQYQQAKTSVLIAPLLQLLQTTYGVPTTGFDPTTTPFAANGQGVDAFFDAYPLTATPNSVQLAAPGSLGHLVRVTLPATAGAEPTVSSITAYAVGGTVSGLAGGSLTLLLNGANPHTLSADGSFTFPTAVSSTYAVTVGTQPTGKICTVSNGSGSGITANVSNIGIACSATTYTVGGTVSGLANGAQVTLRNNGADPTTVTANGAFTFATPVAYNGSAAVTVNTQPVGQTCTFTNALHTGVTANVSNVGVVCSTNTYTIAGTVSGLAGGAQVTLQNNGADPTTVSANGAFTFATPVAFNGSAVVTVSTQPIGQTCTVTNGSLVGVVANVSNVSVTCAARPVYVYVPDYSNASVLGYRINPTTGAFSTIPGSPFAAGRQNRWVTTHPAGTFAYATNQDDNNVSAYSINPSTGALTAVPGSPFATGATPTSITIHPAGTFAYVTNANGNNVSAYSIDATTGALTPVAGSPFAAGVVPTKIGIHPAGTFAYVTNQNENTVSAYSINAVTGALTPVAGSPFTTHGSPGAITINPAGTFAYVTNWQASVSGYSIDPAMGALTPIAGSPFTASFNGWGWQSLAINPAGTFAYVGTGNGGQLLNFSVDPSTGALTEVPANAYGTVGSNYTAFNPAGTLAYVSNAWVLTVSVVRVDPVTGALTNIPGSPFGVGARPFNIAVVQP
ncbi:beta-propeller fold lactonase family protein [Variovorax guangxiensis]|uniref:beta-propeller fold lactonase family protein n=1 Tax=Variovorax guangxiensis TaxID=1775474 RepID=UPI002867615E|nr:beta-propeller fold lactonase family protein [Variovorax guangxiensis]MDR6854269.1 6-phosphogluconolactonase (cycloisomerase 2 family) [Variovorax guangxiensis]